MRYLRRFESLDNISPDDIDDYLIDYIQMGFETDISVGSSYLLDFSKIDKGKDYIGSYEMDSYNKGISNSSLTISLRSNNKSSYKISELEEAYNMLESFLKDEFGLIPNYIMLNGSINRFSYFENFDHIKRFSESGVRTPNEINTYSIIFGFYKPVTPPYKLKKLVESSETEIKDIESELNKKSEKTLETLESFRDDINDILLELEDDVFSAKVSISSFNKTDPFIKDGRHSGWVNEKRYSMVIHIYRNVLKPGQSPFANTNYFSVEYVEEYILRLEDYVKDNLPSDYKLKRDREYNGGRVSIITITINNY